MKSMKKAAALLTAVLLCMSLLTGCHGASVKAEFSVPEQLDDSQPIEITFWAKNDTNKAQTNVYNKAIRDFEALYPNITVNIRLYTDYSRIYNDVITNISTNTTPNVCITYPDHIATYLTGASTVVPLDGLIADEKYGLGGSELRFDGPSAEEIVPEYLSEGRIGDSCYALPYMRSTEALYINKTYVEKLGYEIPDVLTWDFVFEVSEAAMEQGDDGNYLVNGQSVMIPFIYKSTDNMMIQYLKQSGAGYTTDDGEILLFNDTTSGFLKEIAAHAKSGAFSTFKISSYPANFLNAGQCIFAVDSTAGSTWMGAEAPLSDISPDQLVEFETVVRPVPQVDPGDIHMISQGPSVCIFNKSDPQVVLASWLFAQFLLTDDVQISYAETEGYVPVTQKARDTAEYQDYLARGGEDDDDHYQVKIDATQLLLANTDRTFVTPVFNGSASVRDAAGQLIESVTKSVRRRQNVDDAYITQLYSDVSSLYRLDSLGGSVGGGKADLGPLPATAKWLLGGLAAAWAGIICAVLVNRRGRRRE